ncbi:hypothetical protein Ahy_A03g012366 isoform A [Arachis hypogaea]|uniref:Uncharacterized protein n=1 Tax=Arachis hypogaea TaxID=3818 RepID=A0A445DT57_ARAHY|nr:hypothetical protein Ahy_A03g012366 isoform A [Arachis hypogaea]
MPSTVSNQPSFSYLDVSHYQVGSSSNISRLMVEFRQYIDENHHDLVNLLTQRMTTILNPILADNESKYDRLVKQVERITRIVNYDEGQPILQDLVVDQENIGYNKENWKKITLFLFDEIKMLARCGYFGRDRARNSNFQGRIGDNQNGRQLHHILLLRLIKSIDLSVEIEEADSTEVNYVKEEPIPQDLVVDQENIGYNEENVFNNLEREENIPYLVRRDQNDGEVLNRLHT